MGKRFYVDKFLAFGAVYGMRIFQRITDFVRYILAKQGFVVFNYIDDIYACCHVDQASQAFNALNEVIFVVGLPINPVWGSRVYSTLIPTDRTGEMLITQYEMYDILLAIHLWACQLTDRVVCVHCDNESAVTVSNSGRT